MLENTREWCLGRRGEILITAFLARFGYTILDAAAISSSQHAPMMHRCNANLVTPDHIAIRSATFFFETKTKEQALHWRGGAYDDGRHMTAGDAHGIDTRSFRNYKLIDRQVLPVVLGVLCIEDGEFIANSLDRLGEPYPSENPAFEMVNWPARKFIRLFEFDRKRLRRYFYANDGSHRLPPAHMPAPRQLQDMIDWLRPQQLEFEYFRHVLFDVLDRKWQKPNHNPLTIPQ